MRATTGFFRVYCVRTTTFAWLSFTTTEELVIYNPRALGDTGTRNATVWLFLAQ